LEPFIFSLAKGFGKVGLLVNANFLCGWLLITSGGLWIGWLSEDYHILTDVPFVAKRKRK
jgi:hypothetical protein